MRSRFSAKACRMAAVLKGWPPGRNEARDQITSIGRSSAIHNADGERLPDQPQNHPLASVAARQSRVRFAGQDASRHFAESSDQLLPVIAPNRSGDHAPWTPLTAAPLKNRTLFTNVAGLPQHPSHREGASENQPRHESANFTLTFSLDNGDVLTGESGVRRLRLSCSCQGTRQSYDDERD